MERGRQRGQFNFSWRRVTALGQESLDSKQQTLQLFAFRRLLFAEFIPLG